DDGKVRADIAAGKVVLITRYQGMDDGGNITTLGRGGSDTSAVAVAAAMKAAECLIYTDVDGVYTTDPRVVPEARRLQTITFEEMREMASLGANVRQLRSVRCGGKDRRPRRRRRYHPARLARRQDRLLVHRAPQRLPAHDGPAEEQGAAGHRRGDGAGRREDLQGLNRRHRHAQPRGRGQQDVPRAERRG